MIQDYIATRLATVERVVVIDIHTGLGPFAFDTLLVHAEAEGSTIYREMKEAFGERVAALDPDRSVAYRIQGSYDTMFPRILPHAKVYFLCQEFGTRRPTDVLYALREENRWHHYGEGSVEHPAKLRLKEAFNPDDDTWRETVLRRGKEVLQQARMLAFGEFIRTPFARPPRLKS